MLSDSQVDSVSHYHTADKKTITATAEQPAAAVIVLWTATSAALFSAFPAVGGGACASELQDAVSAGCDPFVTADVKYKQFWDAKDLGLNLIDAGHFYTENPVVGYLAEKIGTRFPEIAVRVSEKHRDCMKFFG